MSFLSHLEVLEEKHGALKFKCKSLPFFLTPFHDTVPAACCPACNRVSGAITPRARLYSRRPQWRERDVSTPATAACLRKKQPAEFLTALHSTVPKQFFSSTWIGAQGVFSDPFIEDELVEDCQGLSSSLRARSYLPHRRHECSDSSFTERQERP